MSLYTRLRTAWHEALAARRATQRFPARLAAAMLAVLLLAAALAAGWPAPSHPPARASTPAPAAAAMPRLPAAAAPARLPAAPGPARTHHHPAAHHHVAHHHVAHHHVAHHHRRHPAGAGVVMLVPGDTLWGLAHRYHTTVPALQRLNHLGASTLIYAGAAFHIPAPHRPGHPTPPRHTQAHHTHPHRTQAHPRRPGTFQPASHAAARAIAFARAQLGKPYIWGATGPAGYDCSGLVMRAWQAAGVSLPRVTYDQAHAGTPTTRAHLTPGDLVFSNHTGHVQLYLGHHHVIQAPQPGENIDIVPLPPPWLVDAYIHI